MAKSGRIAKSEIFPLAQKRQADLLLACGFPCAPAGTKNFEGVEVEMYRPLGQVVSPYASLIGYGGAAFGGKSYGLLLVAYMAAKLWPGVRIGYFRRTYPQLEDVIEVKARPLLTGVAKDRDGGKEWQWDNGSALYFRHCQNEADRFNYQGQAFDILLVDEATHFTWIIIDFLLVTNRASGNVRRQGFKPFCVMTTNPGNVGHVWYSSLFDVLNAPHDKLKKIKNQNEKWVEIHFIPAFLDDNQIGQAIDPGYEGRLMQRDPSLADALRWGRWNMFEGQMFPAWNEEMIACDPFEIPAHWPKWRAEDYGMAHACAMGWFTLDPDRERIYLYRAIVIAGLTDVKQAKLMKASTGPDEMIEATYAGHDLWEAKNDKDDNVHTSYDIFKDEGIELTKADTDRKSGVRKIHRLLINGPDGRPLVQVFRPYYNLSKGMAALIRNPKDTEDVLKVDNDGDDFFDMFKYGLTRIKYEVKKPPTGKKATNWRAGNKHMQRG